MASIRLLLGLPAGGDEVFEREALLAIAAGAAASSPRAREVARQGAVYGLAGVLKAGDVLISAGRGAYEGAREGFESAGSESEPDAEPSDDGAAAKRSTAATRKAKASASKSRRRT